MAKNNLSKIILLSNQEATDYLSSWNESINTDRGNYIAQQNNKYIAIDNSENQAWTEEFDNIEKAIIYHLNPLEVNKINELSQQEKNEILNELNITNENLLEMKNTLRKLNFETNYDWSEFNENNFHKLLNDIQKENYNGDFYGRIKCGSVHTDIHLRDDGLSLEHYYPKEDSLYGTYETEDGTLNYESYPGFLLHDIELQKIKNMDFNEFKDYLEKESTESLKNNREAYILSKGRLENWDEIIYENLDFSKILKENGWKIKYDEEDNITSYKNETTKQELLIDWNTHEHKFNDKNSQGTWILDPSFDSKDADKYIYEKIKENKKMENNETSKGTVYTYSPFGYEGQIVTVETDLRRGIPAVDIIGLSDFAVKETRERVRAAISNSDIEFPSERVLIALSPADIKKESPMDLAIALSIMNEQNPIIKENTLVLGELELNGNIRSVRGEIAAVNSAKQEGITNIICNSTTADIIKNIEGINILSANNLKTLNNKLINNIEFEKTNPLTKKENSVQFNQEHIKELKEKNIDTKGHYNTLRALEIAIAGKHNILLQGAPGCGKTILTQNYMQALTPMLTEEESKTPTRIKSLAGLTSPKHDNLEPSFRMPHQTASIEGMLGGGPNCRPGEISLAHNGTLFLDEAAEFRSSILQMLRVPLESKNITLSRAGRTTVYPADFQLAMASNPCPCGCLGSTDKLCLCSAKSIKLYNNKFSNPLLDRVEIKQFTEKNNNDNRTITIDEMQQHIENAYNIQRKNGIYNSHFYPEQIQKYCKIDDETKKYLDKETQKSNLSPRTINNILKTSLTIANMDGRTNIQLNDLKEATYFNKNVFDKPHTYIDDNTNKIEKQINNLEKTKKTYETNVEKTLEKNPSTKTNIMNRKFTKGLSEEQIKNIENVATEMADKYREENSNVKENQNKSTKGRK